MPIALPEPKGRQRDVVFMREEGHLVVLGTAGSGKTTMAMHRARHLAGLPETGGRTLVVTYANSLTSYMRRYLTTVEGVTVQTFHKFAFDYLERRRGRSGKGTIHRELRKNLIERALHEVRAGTEKPLRAVAERPLAFFDDEFKWMAGHAATAHEDYVVNRVERVGRGRRLAAEDRAFVHRVYERYIELRGAYGHPYDYDDLATVLRTALENDDSARWYRHIVIDEGQDLTPEMIRALAAAIPEDGSLTFFGDYAQQIYGSRMSWKQLGLDLVRGHRAEFSDNYRNSRSISLLAQAIAESPHFKDEVDLVQPRTPAADGPPPTVIACRTAEEQLKRAAEQAAKLSRTGRVAVLLRHWKHAEEFARRVAGLKPVKLQKDKIKRWPEDARLFYGAFHGAKGLEFDSVILPLCDAGEMPPAEEVEAHGLDEAQARNARLLYVAVTRARSELILLHSGRLTGLLPGEESGLYLRGR